MTEQSTLEAIFFAALEKQTREERDAYLNEACRDDSDLRRRVERLLAAHPQIGDFLAQPAGAPIGAADDVSPSAGDDGPAISDLTETVSHPHPGDDIGSVIAGRYKLIQSLGQGGMGSVFMARQTEPVKRLVALKLIKPGMDSRQILSRFQAERQALALMDHPNIAKVLDAGATDSGRPFFVMELVKGVPITRFCDERQLSPRERLELFIPVCHAIQHAHQKGIIHRDIKPTNVLIALYDDRPVPKVIDFGVAKAAGTQLTDASLVTGFGAIVGTLEYMSPEQAQLNQLDIDTRSDIFALGVLLYELLTGSTPIDRKRLGQGALLEVLRVIREEEPPRPSVRLSTSETLASIAATRKTEPAKLTRLIRGELDWIVMKCLEKERSRRYATANGLAGDLERYLQGEVVEAQPPSAGYRLRKFVGKHRAGIATLSAFVGLLIAAAGISAALAIKARRAEAGATASSHKANELAESRAAALANLSERERRLRQELIRSASIQIDLYLAEAKDSFTGSKELGSVLLKLARTAGTLSSLDAPPPDGPIDAGERSRLRDLRTFVVFALLELGQNIAPLCPQLPAETIEETREVDAHGRFLLTQSYEGVISLWDIRKRITIGPLQQADERVVEFGFSPDGRTIFTSDTDSVARFWAASDGRFLTKSELRPSRYVYPEGLSLTRIASIAEDANPVHMTNSSAVVVSYRPDGPGFRDSRGRPTRARSGAAEWIDIKTGRVIARLDRPGHEWNDCQVSPDGRWITAVEDKTQVVIFSATDGREVGRLVHPQNTLVRWVAFSPHSKRILTGVDQTEELSEGQRRPFRMWQAEPWRRVPDSVIDGPDPYGSIVFTFLTDDVVEIDSVGMETFPKSLYRIGRFEVSLDRSRGVQYSKSLKHVSDDCRFLFANTEIIDLTTGKRIPGTWNLPEGHRYLPGFGTIVYPNSQEGRYLFIPYYGIIYPNGQEGRYLLPTPEYLDISPNLLELWGQVTARGHLDEDAGFVGWDEPTWERKRQELASVPAPYPSFPFPGHLAVDRFYWLREELKNANGTDKPKLAQQLLDRARAYGDHNEAKHWIAFLADHLVNSVEPFLRAEAEERIRRDASVDDEIRTQALRIAAQLEENPTKLNGYGRSKAIRPNAEKADYHRALRCAEAAVKHEPKNVDFVTTLGALQYRNALYKEAIAGLNRSHEGHRKSKAGAQPVDLAFLAMAHHALGESAKANDYLRQLIAVCELPAWKTNAEAAVLLKETRQRLGQ